MEIVIIIFAIIVGLIFLLIYSFVFGTAFRQLNEGKDEPKNQSNSYFLHTICIGLFLFITLAIVVSKCEG
jgi:hypothetical protein